MGKIDDLEKLQKLKESGALTEDEFKIEKQKILDSDNPNNNKKGTNIQSKNYSTQNSSTSSDINNKKGNPIKIKFSTCLIIVLIVLLGFIGLIKIFTHNSMEDAAKKSMEKSSQTQNINPTNKVVNAEAAKEATEKAKQLEEEALEKAKAEQLEGETIEKTKAKQLEEETIEKAIKLHAENVRDINEGSLKYYSHNLYTTTSDGLKIYKIQYSTVAKSSAYTAYYYQLVSLNSDNTAVTRHTKLYYSSYTNGKQHSNEDDQMEWEAEKIWGIK